MKRLPGAVWRPLLAVVAVAGSVVTQAPERATAAPALVCNPAAPATCAAPIAAYIYAWLGADLGAYEPGVPTNGEIRQAAALDACDSIGDGVTPPGDAFAEGLCGRYREELIESIERMEAMLYDWMWWKDLPTTAEQWAAEWMEFAGSVEEYLADLGTLPDVDIWQPPSGSIPSAITIVGNVPPAEEQDDGAVELFADLFSGPPGRDWNQTAIALTFIPDPAILTDVDVTTFHIWSKNGASGGTTKYWKFGYTWSDMDGGTGGRDLKVWLRVRNTGDVRDHERVIYNPVLGDHQSVVYALHDTQRTFAVGGHGRTTTSFVGTNEWNVPASDGVDSPPLTGNGAQRLLIWWGNSPIESANAYALLADELRDRRLIPWQSPTAPEGPLPTEVPVPTTVVTPSTSPAEVPTSTTVAPTATTPPEVDETPEQEAARELGNRQAGFFDNLANSIGSGFNWLANQVRGFFDTLFSHLTSLFDLLVRTLQGLFAHLVETLRSLLGTLAGWLQMIWQAVAVGLTGILNAVISLPVLIWEQFWGGLTDLFVPSTTLTFELENCLTTLPCSWVTESIETITAVYDGLEGGVGAGCVAPGIGWEDFLVSFPPPSGCSAAAGSVSMSGDTVSAGGDLFGYRVAVRTVLAIAMFVGVAVQIMGWAPWQRKNDAPEQLTMAGYGA